MTQCHKCIFKGHSYESFIFYVCRHEYTHHLALYWSILTFKVNWVILMVWLSEWVMACGEQGPGSKVKPLPHAVLAVLWCWITPAYPIVVFLCNTSGYCLSGHVHKALRWGTEVRRKEIKGQEGRRGLSRAWQNKDNVSFFRALRYVVRMYCWKHDLKYANWFSFVALPVVSTRDTFLLNPFSPLHLNAWLLVCRCELRDFEMLRDDCVCCQRHPSLAVFQFLLVYLVLFRVMHPSGWDCSKALLETRFISVPVTSEMAEHIFEKLKKNKASLLTLSLLQPSKYKIPSIFFFL